MCLPLLWSIRLHHLIPPRLAVSHSAHLPASSCPSSLLFIRDWRVWREKNSSLAFAFPYTLASVAAELALPPFGSGTETQHPVNTYPIGFESEHYLPICVPSAQEKEENKARNNVPPCASGFHTCVQHHNPNLAVKQSQRLDGVVTPTKGGLRVPESFSCSRIYRILMPFSWTRPLGLLFGLTDVRCEEWRISITLLVVISQLCFWMVLIRTLASLPLCYLGRKHLLARLIGIGEYFIYLRKSSVCRHVSGTRLLAEDD